MMTESDPDQLDNEYNDNDGSGGDVMDDEMDKFEAAQKVLAASSKSNDPSPQVSEPQSEPENDANTSPKVDTSTLHQITPEGQKQYRAMTARTWVHVTVPQFLDSHCVFAPKLKLGIQGTTKFQPDISYLSPKIRNGGRDLTLRLWKVDTLVAADLLRARKPGSKIAVLNMANSYYPGGGLLNGSVAQEEALCMRTTLYQGLSRRHYPLQIPDVIYSPDVLVCNAFDGTWTGTPLADQNKWFVDVISAAAVSGPARATDPQTGMVIYADPVERQNMRDGILSILRAAVVRGVNGLVLGAWGCGMFGNPIDEVASMMREIILGSPPNLPPYNWAALGLEDIVIAIYDMDSRNGHPVWNGFLRQFQTGAPFPTSLQVIDTTEICHVLRWPKSGLETGSNGSSRGGSPSKPSSPQAKNSNPDHDSLFGDSGDEEDDQDEPTAANQDEISKEAVDVQGSIPQDDDSSPSGSNAMAEKAASFQFQITGNDQSSATGKPTTASNTQHFSIYPAIINDVPDTTTRNQYLNSGLVAPASSLIDGYGSEYMGYNPATIGRNEHSNNNISAPPTSPFLNGSGSELMNDNPVATNDRPDTTMTNENEYYLTAPPVRPLVNGLGNELVDPTLDTTTTSATPAHVNGDPPNQNDTAENDQAARDHHRSPSTELSDYEDSPKDYRNGNETDPIGLNRAFYQNPPRN